MRKFMNIVESKSILNENSYMSPTEKTIFEFCKSLGWELADSWPVNADDTLDEIKQLERFGSDIHISCIANYQIQIRMRLRTGE